MVEGVGEFLGIISMLFRSLVTYKLLVISPSWLVMLLSTLLKFRVCLIISPVALFRPLLDPFALYTHLLTC